MKHHRLLFAAVAFAACAASAAPVVVVPARPVFVAPARVAPPPAPARATPAPAPARPAVKASSTTETQPVHTNAAVPLILMNGGAKSKADDCRKDDKRTKTTNCKE